MSAPTLGREVRAAAGRLPPESARAVEESAEDLARYLEALLAADARVHLLSRRDAAPTILVERHLVESLEGLELLPRPRPERPLRLLDLGSGGGLPALPLLIVRRDVEGVLVESTGKKARILAELVSLLGLTARVVNARFPDPAGKEIRKLAPFDVLTSRAVAHAGTLVRGAAPALSADARALLWTSADLVPRIERESGIHRISFHPSPGSEARGIALLERST